MTYKRRKKNVKLRGSKTHGYGSMKKHRGAGHRGGRGNAGSGKRADAKKPTYQKIEGYYGKFGFKKKGLVEDIKATNLKYFEENLGKLVNAGLIAKEKDFFVVDAEKMGFNKLLSKGRLTKKFKFSVKYASKNTIEKVKKAGGEVILSNKKKSLKENPNKNVHIQNNTE